MTGLVSLSLSVSLSVNESRNLVCMSGSEVVATSFLATFLLHGHTSIGVTVLKANYSIIRPKEIAVGCEASEDYRYLHLKG